jgi:hypothetical protein
MTLSSLNERLADSSRRVLIAVACMSVLGPAQASTARPEADSAARNEAIVRDAFAAWSAGDSVFKVLAPDVVWTIHGSGPVAGTYRGVKDFTERGAAPLVSRLATPLKPQLHHVWAVGDRVVIRFDASATTTSGAPYNNKFVWIFRMQDGAVVEAEAFLDLVAYQTVVDNNAPKQ